MQWRWRRRRLQGFPLGAASQTFQDEQLLLAAPGRGQRRVRWQRHEKDGAAGLEVGLWVPSEEGCGGPLPHSGGLLGGTEGWDSLLDQWVGVARSGK